MHRSLRVPAAVPGTVCGQLSPLNTCEKENIHFFGGEETVSGISSLLGYAAKDLIGQASNQNSVASESVPFATVVRTSRQTEGRRNHSLKSNLL